MFRLASKIFPYGIIALGSLVILAGLSAVVSPRASEPTTLTMDRLESITKDELPDWVQVNGARLHWEEAVTVFKTKGDVKIEEKLIVPLVSTNTCSAWGRYEDNRKTLLVVSFPWSKLSRDFPKLAAAASINGGTTMLSGKDLKQFDELSFEIRQSDPLFLSALEIGTIQRWKTMNGFSDSVIVELGSEPITAAAGFGMAVFGGMISLGGGFWVRGRFMRMGTDSGSELAAGLSSGISSAVNSLVSEGVSRALERHKSSS